MAPTNYIRPKIAPCEQAGIESRSPHPQEQFKCQPPPTPTPACPPNTAIPLAQAWNVKSRKGKPPSSPLTSATTETGRNGFLSTKKQSNSTDRRLCSLPLQTRFWQENS